MSGETVIGFKCRLCGKMYPKEALNFCTEDFGPLEVVYDYEAVARTMNRVDDRVRGRGRCGATTSSCPWMASRPSAARSAARLWCVPIGWPRRSASLSFTSRTTPSIIRRFRSRIGSSPSLFPRPSSSDFRPSAVPRRATSPTAWRPTRPRPGSKPTCSFPTVSSKARCWAPRSTAPT